MKKTFACGHRGLGKYCHRCEQEKQAAAQPKKEDETKKKAKEKWDKRFDRDPINLRDLPKNVVSGARRIISGLSRGENWIDLGGKKLSSAPDVVKFKLPQQYRLVCRHRDKTFEPVEVLSHEAYNKRWG